MQITDRTTDLLEHYLSLATAQLKVTAGNMANVDTPGFKTLGFDFEAEMRRSLLRGQQDPQPAGSADPSAPDIPVLEMGGLVSRPDGNNVSMEREGMQMAEAQLKFRTGVALLKSNYAQISEAIHADSK